MFHSLRASINEDIHCLAILFFALFILTFVSVLAYSESISDDMVWEELIAGVFCPPSIAESRSDLCYLGGSEPLRPTNAQTNHK